MNLNWKFGLLLHIFLAGISTIFGQDCVKDYLKKNPELKGRFTEDQIRQLCQRADTWTAGALAAPPAAAVGGGGAGGGGAGGGDDLSTAAQLSFLEGLRACASLDCIKGGKLQPAGAGGGAQGGGGGAPGAAPAANNRARRKEIRMMSDAERKAFFAAMNKLKTSKIDGRSKYDGLVVYHTKQRSKGAHFGPAFLPFHREFLKQFELALKLQDQSVALPYWDSSLDQGLTDPLDSVVWTAELFGTPRGQVAEGPFAGWLTTTNQRLTRQAGVNPQGRLFTPDNVTFALSRKTFADLTYCVDPTYELMHGLVHIFVGGQMSDIEASPNDPLFWLNHAFIDYIWAQFRVNQTREQRERDYPPQSKSCNVFNYANNQMDPFSIRNIDGLSNTYIDNFYFYDPSPTCSQRSPNCGSKYLFCDTKRSRCVSKVKIGGKCRGFENSDICYQGRCVQGKCQR